MGFIYFEESEYESAKNQLPDILAYAYTHVQHVTSLFSGGLRSPDPQ